MFASVASGNAPTTDAQHSGPSDDPWLRNADPRTEMVSAWRRRGLNGEVPFGPFGETPVQIVCTTATWDHLTHGWDLAQALGKPYHVDDAPSRGASAPEGKGARGCAVICLGDGVCGFRFFPPPEFLTLLECDNSDGEVSRSHGGASPPAAIRH